MITPEESSKTCLTKARTPSMMLDRRLKVIARRVTEEGDDIQEIGLARTVRADEHVERSQAHLYLA
jgi:hypothetical protein